MARPLDAMAGWFHPCGVMTSRSLLLVSLLLICARADAALSRESPFVSKSGPVAAPVAENSPIELRGLMMSGGVMKFGIFDPAKQQGHWVAENEKGFDFVVRSFDAAKASIVVDYQGRTQTLILKEAKLDGSAPIASVPPPGMPGNAPRPMANGVPSVNSADEAKRIETVAAEVRRRRAMRQAAQGAPAAVPAPTPVPPPPTGAR
jgi:hypothetical protein